MLRRGLTCCLKTECASVTDVLSVWLGDAKPGWDGESVTPVIAQILVQEALSLAGSPVSVEALQYCGHRFVLKTKPSRAKMK